MAKLDSSLPIVGRLGDLSFYTRRGSKDIIVRKAKGISRKRIKNDPEFERTRQNNNEFQARNLLAREIYRHFQMLQPAFDYNVYNALASKANQMQKLDRVNGRGERGISTVANGNLLENIPFNKKFGWENIVLSALEIEMDLPSGSAIVRIPELKPGIDLQNLPNLPFYQVRVMLQSLPEIEWHDGEFRSDGRHYAKFACTNWNNSALVFPGAELELKIPEMKQPPRCIMLSMAIVFGRGDEKEVPYMGAGKIVKVVGSAGV